jgi:3-methyladenine DNA glycosylase AlkC
MQSGNIKRLNMKKVINTATRSVTFTFEGQEPVVMEAEKMSAANYDYAVLHGLAARIGDNAAIQKSAENNFTVTEAMRREAVVELVEFYEDASNKDWNMKQAVRKAAPQNEYILKLAAVLNMTYEECQTKLANDAIQSLTQMGR